MRRYGKHGVDERTDPAIDKRPTIAVDNIFEDISREGISLFVEMRTGFLMCGEPKKKETSDAVKDGKRFEGEIDIDH